MRKGLRALLEAHRGWKVIAEATDGREAVEKATDMRPDVAIVDIGMPSLNGLEATRQIVKKAPRTRVLVLTMHDTNALIQQVVKAGARGYVLKSDVASDLVSAVEALCRDQTFFTSKVSQVILDRYVGKSAGIESSPDPDSPLTPREREVVHRDHVGPAAARELGPHLRAGARGPRRVPLALCAAQPRQPGGHHLWDTNGRRRSSRLGTDVGSARDEPAGHGPRVLAERGARLTLHGEAARPPRRRHALAADAVRKACIPYRGHLRRPAHR